MMHLLRHHLVHENASLQQSLLTRTMLPSQCLSNSELLFNNIVKPITLVLVMVPVMVMDH
jgi:hypothetical protein